MDPGIPPLEIENLLESNPLKSSLLVCGLTVGALRGDESRGGLAGLDLQAIHR